MKEGSIWRKLVLVGLLAGSLAFAGCSADDGSDGASGSAGLSAYELAVANGFTGTEEEWLASLNGSGTVTTAANPESCAVCHNDIAGTHTAAAVTGDVVISNVVLAGDDTGLTITFNAKVDGVNTDAYDALSSAYVYYEDPALAGRTLTAIERSNNVRVSIALKADATKGVTNFATLTKGAAGSGNYTITIPANDGNADATKLVDFTQDNSVYLFRLKSTLNTTVPIVIAKRGTPPTRDLVSNTGCQTCHGNFVFNSSHYSAPAEYCQICHVRDGRSFYNASQNADETWDTTTNAGDGGNLTIYVHGVHNSHNMPAGEAYFHGEPWSVGYPSDMRNCKSCHATDAQLTAAVSAPVNFYLCMSCHQSWDGFVHGHDAADGSYKAGDKIIAGALNFHRTYGLSTDCMGCHGTDDSINEAGDFHNDFQSADSHYNSFYKGQDISFANPNQVNFQVTGVTKSGSDITFTWTASKGGVAVNPCNTDINAGPDFRGLGGYIAYAKGDDWVNEGISTTPGQPAGAKNLFTALSTTCADNVATTTGLTVSSAATYAEKALLAIGGKAKDKHSTGSAFYVRVPSPTYAFSMTDGAAATARRDIVDNSKCVGCHQGTLYQHGGDRIDNTQLCVICHNPASNDKNNRAEKFQIVNADGSVDTASTYDGKAAQTYDLRYLLHSIHGVGKSNVPYVIYRSRGIYAFATDAMEKPASWPADGKTIFGSDNNSTIGHNWTVVHYPKPVNDCEACHFEGTYGAPDQTKAAPLTVDAGTDWKSQADDTVIGPTAAACTSCHNSAPVRSHAETFGYKANVTKDAMIEASK